MKKNLIYIFTSFTFIFFSITFTLSQSGWFQQISSTNKNLYSVQFIDINTGYACGFDNFGSQILKTTNGGSNWNLNYSVSNYYYSINFIDPNTGYISGGNNNLGLIQKTTNGGNNWTQQNSNVFEQLFSIFVIPQTNGNIAYSVGTNGTITQTTNGGINWFLLTSGVGTDLLYVSFTDSYTGYITGRANTVLKTTNSGQVWVDLSFYPWNDALYSLKFTNSQTGYVSSIYSGFPGSGFKSTNSGYNWIPMTGAGGFSLSFPMENLGYVVGPLGRIAKTSNNGINWYLQTSGTTIDLHCVSFVNANTGWAVGDSGTILKTTNGGGPIGIRPISTNVPDKFNLYQNYPNPFNSSTKIRFTIALSPLSERGVGGFTTLRIYDILGHVVTTLVNEQLQPGVYEAEFDGSNYTSGVYFYKLQTDNFADTKKMILLK